MSGPQGSNVGPLLWNVVQNDLVYNTDKSRIKMRADDHQIMLVAKRWKMREDFNGLGNGNLKLVPTQFVEINPDIFQSISLGQRHINEVMKIKVLDKYLESGPEMKLLGITFDEQLKFNSHLDELPKRVSRKIGVLIRLKNLTPTLANQNLQIFNFSTIILLSDGMALL